MLEFARHYIVNIMEKMVAATVNPLSNRFQFGEWTINTMKGTIMKSADAERYQFNYELCRVLCSTPYADTPLYCRSLETKAIDVMPRRNYAAESNKLSTF